MRNPTFCVGADIHLEETVLSALDQANGCEVIPRFRVTNDCQAQKQPRGSN
jgi:hypothetical protein